MTREHRHRHGAGSSWSTRPGPSSSTFLLVDRMSDVTIPARLGRAGKKYGPGPAFVAGWAALGIALSGATQLRVAGVQLGPAEAVLTMWILFVTFLLLRGLNFTTGRVFLGVHGLLVGLIDLAGPRRNGCCPHQNDRYGQCFS